MLQKDKILEKYSIICLNLLYLRYTIFDNFIAYSLNISLVIAPSKN